MLSIHVYSLIQFDTMYHITWTGHYWNWTSMCLIAFSAFYDLSTKLEFNCQYKVQGLDYTPLCLDYWCVGQS